MTTTNLGMTLPTVGADANNWGNELNTDLGLIDTFAGKLMPGAEVTIASGATTDIGGAASTAVAISGTTTITSFGSVANCIRFIRFSGALTLTHNATSLILPGGANMTTVAGDTCIAISDASGNWRVVNYQKVTVTGTGAQVRQNGATMTGGLTVTGGIVSGSGFSDGGGFGGFASSSSGLYNFTYSFGISGSASQFNITNTSAGVALLANSTGWASLSDEDIKIIDNELGALPGESSALEKVATLRACRGRYKTDAPGETRVFLIAQDVHKVLPEAVHIENPAKQTSGWFGEVTNGLMSLQYTDVIVLLSAALKEQVSINRQLEARICVLESRS